MENDPYLSNIHSCICCQRVSQYTWNDCARLRERILKYTTESFTLITILLKKKAINYTSQAFPNELQDFSGNYLRETYAIDQAQARDEGNDESHTLLLKMLYLRWSKRTHYNGNWEASCLENIIEVIFTKLSPLRFEHFLEGVENPLPTYSLYSHCSLDERVRSTMAIFEALFTL